MRFGVRVCPEGLPELTGEREHGSVRVREGRAEELQNMVITSTNITSIPATITCSSAARSPVSARASDPLSSPK